MKYLYHMNNFCILIFQIKKGLKFLYLSYKNSSMMKIILIVKIINLDTFYCTYFIIFYLKLY